MLPPEPAVSQNAVLSLLWVSPRAEGALSPPALPPAASPLRGLERSPPSARSPQNTHGTTLPNCFPPGRGTGGGAQCAPLLSGTFLSRLQRERREFRIRCSALLPVPSDSSCPPRQRSAAVGAVTDAATTPAQARHQLWLSRQLRYKLQLLQGRSAVFNHVRQTEEL